MIRSATIAPAAVRPAQVAPVAVEPVGFTGTPPGLPRWHWQPPVAPAWVRKWRPGQDMGECGSPVCFVCILDESGSVTSTTDPIAHRHALIGRVLTEAARSCTCGRCKAGFVTFDVAASHAPAALKRRSAREMAAELDQLPATSSHLSSALAWAEQAASAAGDAVPVTAVLSDFQIFDPVEANVYGRLERLPGSTLAVVLRFAPPAELEASTVQVARIAAGAEHTAVAESLVQILSAARHTPPQSGRQRPVRPALFCQPGGHPGRSSHDNPQGEEQPR